ncbi:MAG: hypothetical protein JXN60_00865, partial [Lentisphaerae bacterium]|nr:hypothetical protein [Lentisphaerota bacterium]
MTFGVMLVFVLFIFWRPQEWLLPWIFGWPLMDIVVSVAVITFWLETDQRNLRPPFDKPQTYLFIGLWFASLMSHVAHTYFAGMMETIIPTFKICFFGAVLFNATERTSRLRILGRLFVAMGCTMALHSMLQQWRGYGFADGRPLWAPGDFGTIEVRSRYFGIFSDPNDFAQMLAAFIPFSFVIYRRRSFLKFLISAAIAGWLVMGLLATHSRGGLIALATVTAITVIFMLPARWTPFFMLIFAGVALVLCPYSAAWLDESAHERIVYWGNANQMFKENILFGIGAG